MIRCSNIPFPTAFKDGINFQKNETNSSKLYFDHDAKMFTYNGKPDPSYFLKEKNMSKVDQGPYSLFSSELWGLVEIE